MANTSFSKIQFVAKVSKKCLVLVLLLFLTIEALVVVDGGLLVLLVFRDQIVHVALSLCELHLVHAFSSVPVEEGLAAEHGGELLRDSLEQLLDGGRVADEGGGHLETSGRDVADGGLDVVGDPFHEVRTVLVLDSQHLLVHLLHGHPSSEHSRHSKITSVPRVASSHHVLGVEHLLGELRNGQGPVLLTATGCEGGKTGH